MDERAIALYGKMLEEVRAAGLEKVERVLMSPQGPAIRVRASTEAAADPRGTSAGAIPGAGVECANFCSNDYLGLSSHPQVLRAAHAALDSRGYGLSSVRFICGTQDAHKELERRIAAFFGMDDAVLYSSCFDANGGLFETLLGEHDAVISDAQNHASIIDGIRLCKAARHVYPHGDTGALEGALAVTQDRRIRLIATDGVFSMDGDVAPLGRICELADRYRAMVMVDDSHATGFIGTSGRGSIEHSGVLGRVDVVTSTLGKALGGASGGFVASRSEITGLLRQRSRPYLFSNSVAPVVVGASLAVLDLLAAAPGLAEHVLENARHFRDGMSAAGFRIRPGFHPIVAVMMSGARSENGGDAVLAREVASALLDEGIYVVGFSYPVVPKGQARIRVQLSAAHTRAQVDHAIAAFTRAGKRFDLI